MGDHSGLAASLRFVVQVSPRRAHLRMDQERRCVFAELLSLYCLCFYPLIEIHVMLRALLSVQKNVPDARTVIFVHAYRSIDAVPSELHPNARLLDEAFPTITVE